jgi:Protein of unknown function (DUF2971)
MILHKFKSLSDIEYSLDILINERLFCTPFDKLNDPCEGLYVSPNPKNTYGNSIMYDIENAKGSTNRICSLSQGIDSPTMWAHYAKEHKGISIAVDFSKNMSEVIKVDYRDHLFAPTLNSHGLDNENYDIQALSVKLKDWKYEREYRVIQSAEYYSISKRIKYVQFGVRTPSVIKMAIRNILPSSVKCYNSSFYLASQKLRVQRGQEFKLPANNP